MVTRIATDFVADKAYLAGSSKLATSFPYF